MYSGFFPLKVSFGLLGLLLAGCTAQAEEGPADASGGHTDASVNPALHEDSPCLEPKSELYFKEILPFEDIYPGKYSEFSIKDAKIVLDHVVLVREIPPALKIELVHPLATATEEPTFKTKNFVGILISSGRDPATMEAFKKIGSFIKERDTGRVWSNSSGTFLKRALKKADGAYPYIIISGLLLIVVTIWVFRNRKRHG
jgi:hypothetical protein